MNHLKTITIQNWVIAIIIGFCPGIASAATTGEASSQSTSNLIAQVTAHNIADRSHKAEWLRNKATLSGHYKTIQDKKSLSSVVALYEYGAKKIAKSVKVAKLQKKQIDTTVSFLSRILAANRSGLVHLNPNRRAYYINSLAKYKLYQNNLTSTLKRRQNTLTRYNNVINTYKTEMRKRKYIT